MKRILILSASYGEGHNAAARGLLAALSQRGDEAVAEIYDPYPEAFGSLYDRSRKDYLDLIEKHPRVWAFVYALLHYTPLISAVLPFLGKVKAALRQKVDAFKPDTIVSVYPVYSFLLNNLYPPKTRAFRLLTIVTDSITINSVWYRSESDAWLLPNDSSAEAMRKARVPAGRVLMTGFPVPPIFAQGRLVRAAPSTTEPLRVLYMINAQKRAAPALVEELLKIERIALSVTVGRDEELRAAVELVAQRSGKAVKIYGWTPHMPELLMSHHVLIGKAGGAAVQETIAAGTPMLITKVVPGQEEGNARLLVENGCGAVCETSASLAAKLRELAADDARLWRQWAEQIAKLSKPDAALKIADLAIGSTGSTAG